MIWCSFNLITSTIYCHTLHTFSRFFREPPGVVLVPDEGQEEPLVLLVEVSPVIEGGVCGELVLGKLEPPPAGPRGGVQKEDEGEGRGQHRAVVQVLPPQTRSATRAWTDCMTDWSGLTWRTSIGRPPLWRSGGRCWPSGRAGRSTARWRWWTGRRPRGRCRWCRGCPPQCRRRTLPPFRLCQWRTCRSDEPQLSHLPGNIIFYEQNVIGQRWFLRKLAR